MNGHDLLTLGFPEGKIIGLALRAVSKAAEDGTPEMDIRRTLEALLNDPTSYGDDPLYGEVARLLIDYMTPSAQPNLQTYAPYAIWGKQGIDPGAITQMERAVRLPISVRGALMPDAHVGYGLPVGGVLATHNAVIPYAVGVDIACRMRLTIFDTTPHIMEQKRHKFRKLLETLTCFGTGQTWDTPRHHPVMDDPVWREHSLIGRFKDTAWKQLGTSGSGNHFVEFGSLSVNEPFALPSGQELATGKYLALLSHSGSRRLGFEIANHYTEIAMNKWASLPKDYQHLAWLDLNSGAGE
ncbi:MAG TPA: RtcB family protein, partial [Aggregatilineales bacterium]|nr:RtcB family protein [Aggregatilineales bacterium]